MEAQSGGKGDYSTMLAQGDLLIGTRLSKYVTQLYALIEAESIANIDTIAHSALGIRMTHINLYIAWDNVGGYVRRLQYGSDGRRIGELQQPYV